MSLKLNPIPNGKLRADTAKRVREQAADIAQNRVATPQQKNNNESETVSPAFGTFTKGLSHDNFGIVSTKDLKTFISQINQFKETASADETPFPGTYKSQLPAKFNVPRYRDTSKYTWLNNGFRTWESPLGGHTYEINGPDADQVAMPPAPKIGSHELTAEMGEVYGMALLRDKAFNSWDTEADLVIGALNNLAYFNGADEDGNDIEAGMTKREILRRNARFGGTVNSVTSTNLFRGSTEGAHKGPYISQFLLMGSRERPSQAIKFDAATEKKSLTKQNWRAPDAAYSRSGKFVPHRYLQVAAGADGVGRDQGFILYGQQVISQMLVPHRENIDHMTNWSAWYDVQNGSNRKDFDYFNEDGGRFITTPRDLATYVHYDALYQAYLNACLILLGENAPFDFGLPEGGSHERRDAFATFGGPHILTLVCEVSTRALKAVRRQKYNIHLRSRPEMIAHAITMGWQASDKPAAKDALGNAKDSFIAMASRLETAGLLEKISVHNEKQNVAWDTNGWPVKHGWMKDGDKNALLPMAFPEGSPMHPSYGAGHATVAGACVTILKAFFEMFTLPNDLIRGKVSLKDIKANAASDYFNNPISLTKIHDDPDNNIPHNYVANSNGSKLVKYEGADKGTLTIMGELDKLAANIAIGRDFAGVHYYTDYYESLRMGERIAVGLLQEQMLTYREPVSMRFNSFDGDKVLISGTGGSRGNNDALVNIWQADGSAINLGDWWGRASAQS